MFDPAPLNPNFGSYINLQKRVLMRVQSGGVNGQILEVVQQAFDEAILAEGVVLSRGEKKRLLSQITKLLFDEISLGLDSDSGLV